MWKFDLNLATIVANSKTIYISISQAEQRSSHQHKHLWAFSCLILFIFPGSGDLLSCVMKLIFSGKAMSSTELSPQKVQRHFAAHLCNTSQNLGISWKRAISPCVLFTSQLLDLWVHPQQCFNSKSHYWVEIIFISQTNNISYCSNNRKARLSKQKLSSVTSEAKIWKQCSLCDML